MKKRVWHISMLMLPAVMGLCNHALAASSASITISSTGTPVSGPGSITIAFSDTAGHTYSENVPYGPYSTPASIAAYIGAKFSSSYLCPGAGNCTGGLGAKVIAPGSGTVAFQLNNGASFNQPTISNPSPSFSFGLSAWLLTPTISINDIPSSAKYGGSFTPTYNYSGNGSPAESVSSSTTSVCMVFGNTVSFVGVGTCTLTASVTATTDYVAVSGSPQSFAVGQAAPTLELSSSGSQSSYGALVSFTVTISSGFSGAVITFYDGTMPIGTSTVNGTTAVYTTSTLAIGVHHISAGWAGSGNYGPVTSGSLSQSVTSTVTTCW